MNLFSHFSVCKHFPWSPLWVGAANTWNSCFFLLTDSRNLLASNVTILKKKLLLRTNYTTTMTIIIIRTLFESFSEVDLGVFDYDDFMSSWKATRLPTTLKKASNKSCWKLNFLQKSQWANMSIFSWSGVRGLEGLPCLKYYSVLKRATQDRSWNSVCIYL